MRFSTIIAVFAFVAAPAFAATEVPMESAPAPAMPSPAVNEPAAYYGVNRGYAAHKHDAHHKQHHGLPLKQAKTSEVIDRAQHPKREGSKPSASPRPFVA